MQNRTIINFTKYDEGHSLVLCGHAHGGNRESEDDAEKLCNLQAVKQLCLYLKTHPKIIYLVLSGSGITEEGLKELAKIKLKAVNLSNCYNLIPSSSKEEIIISSRWKRIDLSSTLVLDTKLKVLETCPTIKRITLLGNYQKAMVTTMSTRLSLAMVILGTLQEQSLLHKLPQEIFNVIFHLAFNPKILAAIGQDNKKFNDDNLSLVKSHVKQLNLFHNKKYVLTTNQNIINLQNYINTLKNSFFLTSTESGKLKVAQQLLNIVKNGITQDNPFSPDAMHLLTYGKLGALVEKLVEDSRIHPLPLQLVQYFNTQEDFRIAREAYFEGRHTY